MWTVEPLTLTLEDHSELERRVRARSTPHRDRQRAKVVLLAADGVTGRSIAKEVGLSPQSVSKWRIRFSELGLSGLEDAERFGRPLIYGPTDRLVLMAKVTSELPEFSSQWSHSELHGAMSDAGIAISASQIGRILAADDVRPHKVEGWLTRRDTPEFWGARGGHLRPLPLAAGECRRLVDRREDRDSSKAPQARLDAGAQRATNAARVRVRPPRRRVARRVP